MSDNGISKEIAVVSKSGKIIKDKCEHILIPGLDADYCEDCNIYYIDEYERIKFQQRKKWFGE